MDAIRVNDNTRVNQVSSRTQLVRSDSNLIDFFIGNVQMKICSKCKIIKSLSEFYKDHNRKNGYHYQCKTCLSKYKEKYLRTEQGKTTLRKKGLRYRIRHPKQYLACKALSSAIRYGKLPPAKTLQCHYCPAQAKEYHHHKGYAREYQLDVIPVCIPCHGETRKIF